ncbi:MAG: DUF3300 domain-containing protein [Pseudomonadota bacterium]
MVREGRVLGLAALLMVPLAAGAQDAADAPVEPPAEATGAAGAADTGSDSAGDSAGGGEGADLLTEAQLENLVAPIALYPDTLLIQVLVGATQPLEIVKAEQFLSDHEGSTPEDLKPEINAQGWDESVAVLATAFPDVIEDMASHIQWTETLGDAMLAQSDDVMNAVQVKRDEAVASGALVSGEEITVDSDEASHVVITPTDPEVVYVPSYDPDVVYVSDGGNNTGDLLLAGAIGFGTFALIDAIFDDNDEYYRYWGCRNCAGWGGAPIVRAPPWGGNANVNIQGGDREINIDNDRFSIDRNNIDLDRDNITFDPDSARRQEAREDLAKRRQEGGAALGIDRPDRSDALRSQLSERSGAPDISAPGHGGVNLDNIQRAGARLPAEQRFEALRNTGAAAAAVGAGAVGGGALANAARSGDVQRPANVERPANVQRPANVERPANVQRPANIQRPANVQRPAQIQRPAASKTHAFKQRAPAARTRAAGHRGGGRHMGGHRGRR